MDNEGMMVTWNLRADTGNWIRNCRTRGARMLDRLDRSTIVDLTRRWMLRTAEAPLDVGGCIERSWFSVALNECLCGMDKSSDLLRLYIQSAHEPVIS